MGFSQIALKMWFALNILPNNYCKISFQIEKFIYMPNIAIEIT
jgi:hypothetical protein